MRIKTVFTRFYKSFNYDYLRKNHTEAVPNPWDIIDESFYPFVRIPVDRKITTIVGANESGKSHLLSAIEKGVSGKGIKTEDFCRYSQFFAVIEGSIRTPEFGLEWIELSDADTKIVRELCNITSVLPIESFFLFRLNGNQTKIYIPDKDSYLHYAITKEIPEYFLPRTFRIDSEIALPESVSLRELICGSDAESRNAYADRSLRHKIFDAFKNIVGHEDWFRTPQTLQQWASSAQPILEPISRLINSPESNSSEDERKKKIAQANLARDLIVKVARVAPEALQQLQTAIHNGNDGHANGIIEKINAALAARLNFPKFWMQDRDFSLIVSAREYDLVFTIKDRTGTQYAFKERSSGLKYFLSYYIQFLAHEAQGPETEILLMDEPDAFLSSQAQQDLLKVFSAYASPDENTRRPVQVIYVTHSPFLIDKNHADRIRVLEKGVGDEGTRVVRDVARNHYEPLRSAFGAFVGETTFIGNCNLVVEGCADQILLAGMAAYLRNHGAAETETLDLNRITIVPAGSASQIPYLIYLARGRDIEKPAIIALMDSDPEGTNARKCIARGGPHHRQLLDPIYVLQIGDLQIESQANAIAIKHSPIELEDLIPLALCTKAARRYAEHYWKSDEITVKSITDEAIQSRIVEGKSIFDALSDLLQALDNSLHLDKTGFARAVVDELSIYSCGDVRPDDILLFERNMKILFRKLREMQRAAEKELRADHISQKIERLKRGFTLDHPNKATREQASIFLKEVEESLDDTIESDAARDEVRRIRRDFQLNEEILTMVPFYPSFLSRLETMKYAGRLATQETKNQHPPQTESIPGELSPKDEAVA